MSALTLGLVAAVCWGFHDICVRYLSQKTPISACIAVVLAVGLVFYGLFLLEQPVARLAGLYRSGIVVMALTMRETLAVIGIGVSLGLAGSWLAAARHMRRIEPR